MSIKLKLFFVAFLLLFMSSCASKKTHIEVTEKETITDVQQDSSSVTTINKAINDELTIGIGSTGDKECDEKFYELLSAINASKTSGNNSYKLYYDSQLKALRAEFEIGETSDTDDRSSLVTVQDTSVSSSILDEITKTKIPIWVWPLLFYVFRKPLGALLRFILGMVFPPAKGLTTWRKVFTAPEDPKK